MGRKERCCQHRLAWPGNAMHLKAGGEGEEDEEEDGEEVERVLREGGWGRRRESGGGVGGGMLQWLCALKSPADAAE